MAVTLPEALLARYQRFSLYNSPYRAHDGGCAIDLYPGTLSDGRTTAAPSPVSGTVRETRTVRAPPKPYAPEHDHLIVIDCDGPDELEGLTARILHVEPSVAAGDRIRAGDSLGRLVRAGFFAPWVDNHLHVGFRNSAQNPYRASGSLPLEPAVEIEPLAWDGTGRVVSTGDTYAVLDAPAHPDPGSRFVGVGADDGESSEARRSSSERHSDVGEPSETSRSSSERHSDVGEPSETSRSSSERRSAVGGVLDGGLPHYDGGGLLGLEEPLEDSVFLNGDRLGSVEGRTITWDDVTVTANGEPITGLSLFCARDADFGGKLICPDHEFAVGEAVTVAVRARG